MKQTKTLSQLKSELLKEFNFKFRYTSWYSDNWEPIEKFLSSVIGRVAGETAEAVKIDSPDLRLIKRKTKNNLEVSMKMSEFGWFQAHRDQSLKRDKWLRRGK